MIGGQLFLFHVMNLPEVPPLLLERDSAGSSSTVISTLGNDGVMGSDFSSWDTFSVS
jgi:hypothetical protein